MSRQLEYMKRHRERGLCVICPRPAVKGRIRCEMHLKLQADSRKEKYRNEQAVKRA